MDIFAGCHGCCAQVGPIATSYGNLTRLSESICPQLRASGVTRRTRCVPPRDQARRHERPRQPVPICSNLRPVEPVPTARLAPRLLRPPSKRKHESGPPQSPVEPTDDVACNPRRVMTVEPLANASNQQSPASLHPCAAAARCGRPTAPTRRGSVNQWVRLSGRPPARRARSWGMRTPTLWWPHTQVRRGAVRGEGAGRVTPLVQGADVAQASPTRVHYAALAH